MNSKIIERTKFGLIAVLIALVSASPAISASNVKHIEEKSTLAPIARIALKYQGIPYVWGGSSPNTGFDCSGLTRFVWGKRGIYLAHSTYSQINIGVRIYKLRNVRPGDLLFPSPDHVMMYIGNEKAIHAPHSGDVVRTVSIFDRPYIEIRRPNGPKAILARRIHRPLVYYIHEFRKSFL